MANKFREPLIAAYGPLMDAKTICKVLYYPSVSALLAARTRGRINFPILEFKGRRGYFAATEDIALYMQNAHDEATGAVLEPVFPAATAS